MTVALCVERPFECGVASTCKRDASRRGTLHQQGRPTFGDRVEMGAIDRVYAGSTPLSCQVLGRHFGDGDSLERCGLARLRASPGDS